ncbi:hypothetical protein BGW36DRAFT_426851 [Talaromyces proteolyticus]|uniref:Uncharacterized protein n=1 Tax=Talaromyces proteolyticus TaxID=1131652 RepID=A0AAD4Q226_9EURO|nr:uncharacterized protein BGW36DRAFT_426851 [Talaromyces proteolyticus]KAH8699178.1 hypothetical protein BGW36DRAFT_426851 [Talaromyces proteolyticus]
MVAAYYIPPQPDTDTDTTMPLPYTASPLKLLAADILLCLSSIRYLPNIVRPLRPCRSGKLDELYPSWGNITALAIHGVLIVYQLAFILSLPALFFFPVYTSMIYTAAALVINKSICMILNGSRRFLVSQVPVDPCSQHGSEHWVFINGVGVGQHWLQSNLDRLSLTFGRKVTGVHNDTTGIIFDIIQCLIQRCFCYATDHVRDAHVLVKEALLSPEYRKVILILHSQGAVEGGLIIDWLFDELDQSALDKLEIYTFGNAANHWNNPIRTLLPGLSNALERRIRYIEHYVNSKDFVAIWGILHFIKLPYRYRGTIFIRDGCGHQLNQHYLDTMFPLSLNGGKVLEENDFVGQEVELISWEKLDGVEKDPNSANNAESAAGIITQSGGCQNDMPTDGNRLKLKSYSRLWQYRNGGSPPD